MHTKKAPFSFFIIFTILIMLAPSMVLAENDPISIESLQSSSENGIFYENEYAVLKGTVKAGEDMKYIELGLYVSGSGLNSTCRLDDPGDNEQIWKFDVRLPGKGDYDEGYYFVKIMNAGGDASENEYKADAPAFSVETREETIPTGTGLKLKPNAIQVFSNQYTAKSADGAISITFSTNGSVTGPCIIEYTALTDADQKMIMTKDIRDDYYDFYGVGDVKIFDGDHNEITVKNATAEFNMDILLRGAIALDSDYYNVEEDDWSYFHYDWGEDYGDYDDGESFDFSNSQIYTMGTSDWFYDFDGDLFVYDWDDDRYYNRDDHDDYYISRVEKYGTDAGHKEDDDNINEEDDDEYNDEDTDYNEDMYYSIDGLYYYYYNDAWEYDEDMDDGYYFDYYFNVFCFDGRCYYYDSEKDAFFIDEQFEADHPDYFDNIHFMIDTEKSIYGDDVDDDSDYDDEEWDNEDLAITNVMKFVSDDEFSYADKYGLYYFGGNFFKKQGDAYYFDQEFNPYQFYGDGKYFYTDLSYYDDYDEVDMEECFYKKKSGERVYLENYDEDVEYFDPDYKTNKDIISYDKTGAGNKFSIKKGTEVALNDLRKKNGTDWAKITSEQKIDFPESTMAKISGSIPSGTTSYMINRLGFTDLNGLTPILDKDENFNMLHINNDTNKVEAFDAELSDKNIMTVENASFSPTIIASKYANSDDVNSENANGEPLGSAGDKNGGFGVLGRMSDYKTGDDNDTAALWLCLMIITVIGLGITTYRYRRQFL